MFLAMTLKQWRKKWGLSLRNVADDLKCSPSMVSYIEKGTRAPSMAMAKRIIKLSGGEIQHVDLPSQRLMP
jgi:predicted transcriptional regulator